jgi:hypothetical protein
MTFVDLALTDDSAVAISSSVILNFTFPEKITSPDRNGNLNSSMDEQFFDGD